MWSGSRRARFAVVGAVSLVALGCSSSTSPSSPNASGTTAMPATSNLAQLQHLVVIAMENHSFDNYWGQLPGVDGLSQATPALSTQIDQNDNPYPNLAMGVAPFPATVPNAPWSINQYIDNTQTPPDNVHTFYQDQVEINHGQMNLFGWVNEKTNPGLVMSYYTSSQLPLAQTAQKYVVLDHFFHGAFGASWLNHIWEICACVPLYPNAPQNEWTILDANGVPANPSAAATADGTHAINTMAVDNPPGTTQNQPYPPITLQTTLPTIGDSLSAAGVSWAWYAQGWNTALAGQTGSGNAAYHRQPFLYFQNYADGTPAKAQHLQDQSVFDQAAQQGNLPAVSFVQPALDIDEHPAEGAPSVGEAWVMNVVNEVMQSPNWSSTAIVVMYDESGGYWDHVAPPTRDQWGPGGRVPATIISPLVRQNAVDSTVYETESILATIEHRWNIPPLNEVDAKAQDLSPAFGS